MCDTEYEIQREKRKQKSLPFLSLIPLFSATLNKDEQGKKQSEENNKEEEVRRCVSLALFNFKD